MKCGLCRKSGHNRTTCPRNPPRVRASDLPRAAPDELMHMLIDPMQALALVTEGNTAKALANATRQIGELNRNDLGHLACRDILVALAELDLRATQISPELIEGFRTTRTAIAAAEEALEAARRAHTRTKAEVLIAIGYRAKVEQMDFRVDVVEAEAAARNG